MINLATVGTNWITQQLIDAIKADGRYALVGIYSRHAATAERFAARNQTTGYTDFAAMLKQPDLDVVYIASPNSVHFEQVMQVIAADISVIVEKPAFSNPTEMAAVQTLLQEHPSVRYFEAARHIHTPNFRKIAEAVGQLPRVQGGTLTYMKYSSRYDQVLLGEKPNVFTRQFSAGALYDLGVYPVYDAVALFGLPDQAHYFPILVETGADGQGVAVLQYPNFNLTLNFGKTSNAYALSEIYGLKETLDIDDAGELRSVILRQPDGTQTDLSAAPLPNSMAPEVADFADVLQAPKAPDQLKRYERWRQLSVQVAQLLFDLRQSAGLDFPADQRPH